MKERDLLPFIDGVIQYLEKDCIFIEPDKKQELFGRARDLRLKIKNADDRIVIGLVGGTGVGKSTLINALAGREISVSTDIRPTTNHLVLYKHKDNTYSLSKDEEVHLHDAEPLSRVSLVDFPDFDSIEDSHRQLLSRYFQDLDLLLWVVDPVKYADQTFYNWLNASPHAAENSVFVFNKLDEYERRYGDEAELAAEEVKNDFQQKLRTYARLEDVEIIPLSALTELKGGNGFGKKGFDLLKTKIERLKERKLRISIKNMNLRAMALALGDDLDAAADVSSVTTGIEKLNVVEKQGKMDIGAIVVSESRSIYTVYKSAWRDALTAGVREHAPWPLDFFIFIWDRIVGLFRRRKDVEQQVAVMPNPEMAALLRRLVTFRAECERSLGAVSRRPAAYLAELFKNSDEPENVVRNSGVYIRNEAFNASEKLKKKFRWRIRHHLAPALILIYPFAPILINLATALATGENPGDSVNINITLGWRDFISILEIVAGVYVLTTLYYIYSLERTAVKMLGELSARWGTYISEAVDMAVFRPVSEFKAEAADNMERLREVDMKKPG